MQFSRHWVILLIYSGCNSVTIVTNPFVIITALVREAWAILCVRIAQVATRKFGMMQQRDIYQRNALDRKRAQVDSSRASSSQSKRSSGSQREESWQRSVESRSSAKLKAPR